MAAQKRKNKWRARHLFLWAQRDGVSDDADSLVARERVFAALIADDLTAKAEATVRDARQAAHALWVMESDGLHLHPDVERAKRAAADLRTEAVRLVDAVREATASAAALKKKKKKKGKRKATKATTKKGAAAAAAAAAAAQQFMATVFARRLDTWTDATVAAGHTWVEAAAKAKAATDADVEEEADRFSREVQPVLTFLETGSNTAVVRVDTSTGRASSAGGKTAQQAAVLDRINEQIDQFPVEVMDVLLGRSSQ